MEKKGIERHVPRRGLAMFAMDVIRSDMKRPPVSPDADRASKLQAFNRLLTVMDELRENCPWDKKQTFESLRHLTIEETYELSDAILEGDLL